MQPLMMSQRRNHAFSLIEVVIATAILAGAITVILAMLPNLARQTTESNDAQTALRLADALESQLQTRAAGGLDSLANAIPIMNTTPDSGLLYTAERDGSNLRALDPAETPPREQYFLLAVRRFERAPLAYDASKPLLAVNALVSWPYRGGPDGDLGAVTTADSRRMENFNLVLAQ